MNIIGHVRGPDVGLMASLGPIKEQAKHLEFLGVPVEPDRTGNTSRQNLGTIEGFASADFYQQRLGLEQKLLHGIHDRSADNRARVAKHLRATVTAGAAGDIATAYDEVSLCLLDALNVEPAWLLVLSALFRNCDIHFAPDEDFKPVIRLWREHEFSKEPIMQMDIRIGEDVAWCGEGVRVKRDFPISVATAFAGRPLHKLVSHPILDQFNLTIKEFRADGIIDVGYVPYKPLDWPS